MTDSSLNHRAYAIRIAERVMAEYRQKEAETKMRPGYSELETLAVAFLQEVGLLKRF